MSYKPLLQTRYEEVVVPALKEKFGYKNVMEMPRLVKVSLNQGVGAAVKIVGRDDLIPVLGDI